MLIHVAVGNETVQFRPVIDDAADGGKKGMEVGIVIAQGFLFFNESDKVGNIFLVGLRSMAHCINGTTSTLLASFLMSDPPSK